MGYELHPLPMIPARGQSYAIIGGERVYCESAWYVEKIEGDVVRREFWARSKSLEPGRLMFVDVQPYYGGEVPKDG